MKFFILSLMLVVSAGAIADDSRLGEKVEAHVTCEPCEARKRLELEQNKKIKEISDSSVKKSGAKKSSAAQQ